MVENQGRTGKQQPPSAEGNNNDSQTMQNQFKFSSRTHGTAEKKGIGGGDGDGKKRTQNG